MKLVRKKDLHEVKIEHNRVLLWIIIFLTILLIWLIFLMRTLPDSSVVENKTLDACNIDSDCVPNSCCHAVSCVNKINSPNCSGIKCSMECQNNTLDCKQTSCKCVQSKCSVIKNEDFKK